jgi:ABC-type transporter Mla subunit MlaD
MTTKKTGNSKTSTVQALDLSDLDGIVGGATSPAPAAHPHDPSQDQAFLATLGNVAAVVSTAATAVSSGHETAQTAINTVEAAAQAQHISTAAALTDLLGATHGNQTVATALTTGLVNGSSEAELVNLAANGSLHLFEGRPFRARHVAECRDRRDRLQDRRDGSDGAYHWTESAYRR